MVRLSVCVHHERMPKPRKRLVSIDATPYYHCVSRCVRRAFLCGIDSSTGFDFSHRRGWIENRIAILSTVFSVDVYAYAVMSNHYHLVLRIDAQQAASWTDREIAERWRTLFSGPPLVHRWSDGDALDNDQLLRVKEYIDTWRERLSSLSWFMRCLNETIARMANKEDRCTGRFWEGRFRSQALLDERALLACMAYVDLNPIRAGLAAKPEASDFTSIHQRIHQTQPSWLGQFKDQSDTASAIPFTYTDYLNLVDWSGRAVHPGKRGNISLDMPPILARLGINEHELIKYLARKPDRFGHALGGVVALQALAKAVGLKFLKGVSLNRRLFPEMA